MRRFIFLTIAIFALVVTAGACADPARTDGTVTAWIGEENEFFLHCSDGVTRKLSTPMKDILRLSDTEVIGLTQDNQIVAVKKDGTGYSIVSTNASDADILGQTDAPFILTAEGKLSVGDTVYSERAAAAVTDGLILYWVNKGENGFVLMQKEMPGKEAEAISRVPTTLTGISVPEPQYLCVTAEALTLTAADRSITVYSLETGESRFFAASGQDTAGACMADDRLYRYTSTSLVPWVLETIQNDAMQLTTVTPVPTTNVTPSPTPTATPTNTTAATTSSSKTSSATATPDDGNIYKGASGKTVRKIQQRLLNLGYPVGSVDGSYGDQTQVAVNLFYDAIRRKEHKYITPYMYERLFASDAPEYDPYMPLQKGDEGLSVKYMQMALQKAGYDLKKADGIYGDETVKAVAEYQVLMGYEPAKNEVPGEYASRDLLEKLLGPEPTRTPDPTPTPTPTPSPTPTPTPEPTPTPSPTPSPTPVTQPETGGGTGGGETGGNTTGGSSETGSSGDNGNNNGNGNGEGNNDSQQP